MPTAIDWFGCFVPAVARYFAGLDPYAGLFYNAPWTLPLLAPFAALPLELGRVLLLLASVTAFLYAAFRFGSTRLGGLAFVTSPLVIGSLLLGNVEWLAALGLAVAGPVGIALALVKPQMSVGVILFWLIERFRAEGLRRTLPLALFPLALGLVSLVLVPAWVPKVLSYRAMTEWSFFPWSVPLGLVLFLLALRTHRVQYALAASPCFFPSVTPQVWLVVFLAIVPWPRLVTGAWVAGWAALLARVVLAPP